MFKHIKQLAGESAVYGLASMLTRFISLFATPIYTRIFLPHDYGVMGLVNTLFILLNFVVVLGLDSATAVYFYEREGDKRKEPVATWFWTQLLLSLVMFAICIIFSGPISKLCLKEDQYGLLIILNGANLVLALVSSVLSNWFRLQRKALHTVVYSISISLINIGASVFFVLKFKAGIAGIYYGAIVSNVIAFIAIVYFMHDWLWVRFYNVELLKKMLKFSLPLIPASFAFWALNSSGSYFIDHYLNKSDVGLYQIGASLASGMFLFTGAFQTAWGPFALSLSKSEDAKQIYASSFLAYTAFTSVLFVFLCVFSKEILRIITTQTYVEAYKVGCLLAFNFILTGFNYIAAIGLNIAKTNSPFAKIIIVSAILTVGLFFVLIPVFGKEGAAMATVAGQLVVTVYMFYAANKFYPVNYNYPKALFIIIIAIAHAVAGNFIQCPELVLRELLKVLLVSVFILLMYFINRNVVHRVISAVSFKLKAKVNS